MPQLIEHIDAIARQKNRDVLYLTFFPQSDDLEEISQFIYQKSEARKTVLQWLDANGIVWQPCGEFARTNVMMSHLGSVYLDVPFDTQDANFQKLTEYLENPDGSMKIKDVTFWAMRLEHAMKNKHHDEPGFWERWAENF